MRRRVLEKLQLTEISAVDRPCQEGARWAIMKRAEDSTVALEKRIAKARESLALVKYSASQPRDDDGRWTDGISSAVSNAADAARRFGRTVGSAITSPTGKIVTSAALLAGGLAAHRFVTERAMRTLAESAAARIAREKTKTIIGSGMGLARKPRTLTMAEVSAAVARAEARSQAAKDSLAERGFAAAQRIKDAGRSAAGQTLSTSAAAAGRAGARIGAAAAAAQTTGAVGSTAQVAFMVTRDQKQRLLDLGYKMADIKQMTPGKAHELLIGKYSVDQARDDLGRWAREAGSAVGRTARAAGRAVTNNLPKLVVGGVLVGAAAASGALRSKKPEFQSKESFAQAERARAAARTAAANAAEAKSFAELHSMSPLELALANTFAKPGSARAMNIQSINRERLNRIRAQGRLMGDVNSGPGSGLGIPRVKLGKAWSPAARAAAVAAHHKKGGAKPTPKGKHTKFGHFGDKVKKPVKGKPPAHHTPNTSMSGAPPAIGLAYLYAARSQLGNAVHKLQQSSLASGSLATHQPKEN